MGPRSRYLGPEVPAEDLIWQDPVPARDFDLIDGQDVAHLKATILASGLSVSSSVYIRWAFCFHFPRVPDKRVPCQRARIPAGAPEDCR